MLEILALIMLVGKIGKIVEGKGHKSGWYKVLAIGLWVDGEFGGFIVGFLVTGGAESDRCAWYLITLAGAAVGAIIAYAIVNNLPALPKNQY